MYRVATVHTTSITDGRQYDANSRDRTACIVQSAKIFRSAQSEDTLKKRIN